MALGFTVRYRQASLGREPRGRWAETAVIRASKTAHPDRLPVGDGGEQGSWAGMLDGAAVLGETSASLGGARLHRLGVSRCR